MARAEVYQRSLEHPDLPGLRRSVVAGLHQEIGALLGPLAYRRQGRCWVQHGLLVTSYLEVQRSVHGFDCYLNVGRELRWPGRPVPRYRNGTHRRIGSLPGSSPLDALPYVDLEPGSPLRVEVSRALREQVLPFLRRCHGLLFLNPSVKRSWW